ncbi:MAG TPA: metalloregulator ArsR/SmtB family transcription factor [Ktedonobacterales bacterium]
MTPRSAPATRRAAVARLEATTPRARQDDGCELRCIHPRVVAEAREQLRDQATYQAMAGLFAVLADPTRAQVVHLLLQREMCSCDLAAALRMSAPRVSQHLRVLRAQHIVKTRRDGKFVMYSLDDAHVRRLFQLGLAHASEADLAAAGASERPGRIGSEQAMREKVTQWVR